MVANGVIAPQVKVRVFYHDKCFDGACSASLFARFHRERITTGAEYSYHEGWCIAQVLCLTRPILLATRTPLSIQVFRLRRKLPGCLIII